MKNHELLDMIGDVNEDYVQAADSNVARPRFRWKALAACAALVLVAYPVYQALRPAAPQPMGSGLLPLHPYTVMEGGALTTQDDLKAPAGGQVDVPGQNAPDPNPDQPPRGNGPEASRAPDGGTGGEGIDGTHYSVTGDVPVDEETANQYSGLLQGLGGQNGLEPDAYPEWFAGAWIDHGGAPDAPARLAVAIVDSFRTPELESQVRDWCGGTGEILFVSAKYSYDYLDSLMDPAVHALSGTGLYSGVGVDVTANCLGLDLYTNEDIPMEVLVELGKLDPPGDAIRVRVFTQAMSTLTIDGSYYETQKGPAPDRPAADPVEDDERAEPAIDPEAFPTPIAGSDHPADTADAGDLPAQPSTAPAGSMPSGARAVDDLPEKKCGEYDAPDSDGGLADYDLLGGADDLPGYGLMY